ncbi:D-alanyl-D-alanine carboxypeptidase family protein [Eubacteriales bacterium OttesenSCG-928-G02]|nr:D-alanyl-D-alanine carboxypeptidase family protein [Eubacteriales bacterium OttesenSCG-928-G02]
MSKKRNETYKTTNMVAVIVCFAVIVIILTVLFADNIFGSTTSGLPKDESSANSNHSNDSSSPEESIIDVSEEVSIPEPEVQFTTLTVSSEEVKRGDLILVSNNYLYDFSAIVDMVNIFKNKNEYYVMSGTAPLLQEHALKAFNKMMLDLYTANGAKSTIVLNGFRTQKEQEDIYNKAKDKTTAIKAGGSDLHTGLTLQLSVYPANQGKMNEGDYAWIKENCEKYGFIQRYPENKSSVTGISGLDTYYRYIGEPHAYFMTMNNLTLEEYIEFLKNFNNTKRYSGVAQDGKTYEIYYQSANSNSTVLNIPADYDYTVSGNNIDGFIITFTKD